MRGLSAASLKLIAAAAMLLDHIAWLWLTENAAPGFILHTIGRITAPVMCFFIAEGLSKTRSAGRYALRLLIFAIIAQVPYHYFHTGTLAFAKYSEYADLSAIYNMLFTLLLGLIALYALRSRALPRAARLLSAALCCAASYFCDWPLFGVMFILVFGAHSGRRQQAALFLPVCAVILAGVLMTGGGSFAYYAGAMLALPLLWTYNGKRGGNTVTKYAFYAFYPAHLFILAYIKYGLPA